MAQCTYENFDITIQGSGLPYMATVAYRGQSAEGSFDQDITLPQWQAFDDHAANPGQTNGKSPDIARHGSDLFRALIHGDLRDLWVTAQAELDRRQVEGLRIRLILRPPAVAALPWEFLRDPDRRRTLAANKRILLVRMETLQRYVGPPRPLEATLPLKLLLALPTDPTGQIDGQAEEAGIRAGLTSLGEGRINLITLTGRFDVLKLGEVLEQERPDIVHMVTHGLPDGILLWQADEPTLVSPDSLRTALEWTDSVKLVVLNACQSAKDPVRAPLASLGAQLLQTGLPAVIAMQFPIQDQAAMRFAQLLYTSLMDGQCAGRVDAAVAQARSGLYALNNQENHFGTPVLWLNSPDGVIFNLPAQDQSNGLRTATSPDASWMPAIPAKEIEIAPLIDWIDSLLQRSPNNFVGDLKWAANRQHELLGDLQNGLKQLQGLYQRRAQGALVSPAIHKLEDSIADQQTIVQRLETMIQAHLG